MTGWYDLFIGANVATAFGAAGLAGQLLWPLLRSRSSILAAQVGISASYGAQYAMMDQWSGAGVCCIGASQALVALVAGDRAWLRHLGLGFVPLVGAVGFLTWCGAASALAMTACLLVMLGRMQTDVLRMRAILLCAAPFGIGYDLAVGAAPALAGGVLSALIGTVALRRAWLNRRRETAGPALAGAGLRVA